MGGLAQMRLELRAQVVDLAFDGVSGHCPFCPALGDHSPQPDALLRKEQVHLALRPRHSGTEACAMQCKVRRSGKGFARQNCLELGPGFQSLHVRAHRRNFLRQIQRPKKWPNRLAWESLDSQAFAALGTARIDHSTATAGLHANQKAVGTGAADFGGLVCAFHWNVLFTGPRQRSGKPKIIANFLNRGKATHPLVIPGWQGGLYKDACG
jgi:hypothetical protein